MQRASRLAPLLLPEPRDNVKQSDKIFVAGHRGLVGSALVRRLLALGFDNLVLRTRDELDLEDIASVRAFFEAERPNHVFLAAARVGGIFANNTYPADFIHDNLLVQISVIEAARATNVDKMLFLGSSCIYPKFSEQPIREEALLTGELEPTNEAYAVAKIAGIIMCRSYNRQHGTRFMSVMPTNLYGEGDNFERTGSHVLPALMRRFHDAKLAGDREVVVWGTGTPRREFLHVDDMADASIHLMRVWAEPSPDGSIVGGPNAINEIVNVGYGDDIPIGELAKMVKETVGYQGTLAFDTTKPDGTPRKLLDSTRLHSTGWSPKVSLREGLARTYAWFLENHDEARLG
ncbi:MAG: NAD-dependent epimerase/dehydratase [Gemmatimonadetes bacterium]|nr:NAD-dependent epimerase/dehydratase [Gemmatimonadota bacterium]